jgi:radical SAM superfamily enzyme YgiQ (UPF0313 family)
VTRGYEIARMYRDKGIPTIMGGVHVTMMSDEALNYCDAVVIGEAEGVWPQLLNDFEAGKLQQRYEGGWIDLDNLSLPRRDVLQTDFYKWGSIQTSRGCPLNCSFCSVTAFNGKRFRRRNLDAVIKELKQIPQKFVLLSDDNFIGHNEEDKAWAKEFFRRVRKEGIKKYYFAQGSMQFGEDKDLIKLAAKAGLKVLFIGIESINPDSLRSHNKALNLKRLLNNKYYEHISNIRRGGIAVLGAFMLGNDDDTHATFGATLEFLRESNIDVAQITKPTPLPGTLFWSQLVADGRILNTDFPQAWEEYRLTKMVYEPTKMSIEDVYKGFTYLKKEYFRWPEMTKRTLSTLFTTKSLVTTVMAYKFNKSYRKAFIESEHYRLYNQPGLEDMFKPQ